MNSLSLSGLLPVKGIGESADIWKAECVSLTLEECDLAKSLLTVEGIAKEIAQAAPEDMCIPQSAIDKAAALLLPAFQSAVEFVQDESGQLCKLHQCQLLTKELACLLFQGRLNLGGKYLYRCRANALNPGKTLPFQENFWNEEIKQAVGYLRERSDWEHIPADGEKRLVLFQCAALLNPFLLEYQSGFIARKILKLRENSSSCIALCKKMREGLKIANIIIDEDAFEASHGFQQLFSDTDADFGAIWKAIIDALPFGTLTVAAVPSGISQGVVDCQFLHRIIMAGEDRWGSVISYLKAFVKDCKESDKKLRSIDFFKTLIDICAALPEKSLDLTRLKEKLALAISDEPILIKFLQPHKHQSEHSKGIPRLW